MCDAVMLQLSCKLCITDVCFEFILKKKKTTKNERLQHNHYVEIGSSHPKAHRLVTRSS